jgi:hypothetical protein
MSTKAFGAFIDVDPSSSSIEEIYEAPIAPQKAAAREYPPRAREAPDPLVLDNLQWGAKLNGPSKSGTATPSRYQTPIVSNDLEMSRPASPTTNENDGVDALQSFASPPMSRFRMLSVCLINFGNGLSDSAPGALIPYIEKYILPPVENAIF